MAPGVLHPVMAVALALAVGGGEPTLMGRRVAAWQVLRRVRDADTVVLWLPADEPPRVRVVGG